MTSGPGGGPVTSHARADLRLLPTAVCAWFGSWFALVLPGAGVLALVLLHLVVAAWCLARLGRRPRGRHRLRWPEDVVATVLLAVAVGAGITGLAGLRAVHRHAVVEPLARTGVAEVLLLVRGEARWTSAGDRLLVDVDLLEVAAAGEVTAPRTLTGGGVPATVLCPPTWYHVVPGERVRTTTRLALTEPGDASAVLVLASAPPVRDRDPPPLAAAVASLRAGLVAASAGLAPQGRGLVPGITLGDTRLLPVGLEEDLRTVALTHVTAVSGAHVAIIVGGLLVLTWWAPRGPRIAVGALVLVGFVMLVHPSGSVLRAAAMGAVMLAGMAATRPRAALPALWVSVVLLVGWDPWISRSFGFVLSVLATAGLLAWVQPIANLLGRYLPRPLAFGIAVPVAAQVACTPVILLLAPGISTYGVVANALAAPAVPPATVLGVLATLVAPWWPAGAVALCTAAGWCTAWIATVTTRVAALPLATLPWPGGPGGLVLLVALAGAAAVGRSRVRARRVGAPARPA